MKQSQERGEINWMLIAMCTIMPPGMTLLSILANTEGVHDSYDVGLRAVGDTIRTLAGLYFIVNGDIGVAAAIYLGGGAIVNYQTCRRVQVTKM